MSFDYAEARGVAEEIISFFGAAGSFVKTGAIGGYDDYGNVTPDEPDSIIEGVVSPLLDYLTSEIDGESILATDSYCYFHSETLPDVGMTHTQNGVKYRAQNIETLTSVSGVNVYCKVQLRRG